MDSITPTKPSHAFGYWKPWKDNSNLFDSYLDYVKDVSLAKYGADTVGKYIGEASKEQVQAINQLGQSIGRGINILSTQMSDVNNTLDFINRNIDIQIEQQKLSNLLLQNITDLLRIPDIEKERQHSIELGIKFFVNAQKDEDLYADALEELLKAESMMKQDYFVLHRIGLIYLHVEKFIAPEKALDYFLRAAKYASVETNPKSMRLIHAFISDRVKITSEDKYTVILKVRHAYTVESSVAVEKMLELHTAKVWEILSFAQQTPQIIKSGIDRQSAESIKYKLEQDFGDDTGIEVEIITSKKNNYSQNISCNDSNYIQFINSITADSYEKASFSAYILGRFEDAVKYQTKALKYNSELHNLFLLAKYQIRNGKIEEAIENLETCIDQKPLFVLAAFKELDFINEKKVINLITMKNGAIDNKIKTLIERWKTIDSKNANKVVKELIELSNKSYEIKIAQFIKFEIEGNKIDSNILNLEMQIDLLINEINNSLYLTLDIDKKSEIIKNLEKAKELPIEKMQIIFDKLKRKANSDRLRIGSNYAGGIVFYIDESGHHGLVCADKDQGQAIWGSGGEIGVKENYIRFGGKGSGRENTKKIVEKASWVIDKGFFNTTKRAITSAARLCLELNYNGYSDWYLPTKMELELMHRNLNLNNIGNFNENYYWSCVESYEDAAYVQFFHNPIRCPKWNGGKLNILAEELDKLYNNRDTANKANYKKENNYVRAARAF
jgi:hypothetical protein